MAILITGGAGYIGTHTSLMLLEAGYDIIILDNFSNSKPESIRRVEELSGKHLGFVPGDVRDRSLLDAILGGGRVQAVIHFAGLKAVGESVQLPLEYYDNNIGGTVTLLEAMRDAGCKKIVFSSSATVYGEQNVSPLREDMPDGQTTNPYGTTKLYIERILKDLQVSDDEWSISLLRYFNPIGAHESGRLGEDPPALAKNLMPIIVQTLRGEIPHVPVAGNDYDTPDGTGIRDYLHVMDLANGHLKALERVLKQSGCDIYNLGTGQGYSVLEILQAMEKACGKSIPREFSPRRPGDLAACYSDSGKAERELGWKAQYGLERMCADVWRFLQMNPQGYGSDD